MDEFLAAIAPNATICLEPGEYNLTDASTYAGLGGEYYHWESVYDGYELVIRGANNLTIEAADRGINRNFNSPDVTGISWNTTEFQLYGVGDVAQINSVAGMREVAEKLKAILDVDNALPETSYDQKKISQTGRGCRIGYEGTESL